MVARRREWGESDGESEGRGRGEWGGIWRESVTDVWGEGDGENEERGRGERGEEWGESEGESVMGVQAKRVWLKCEGRVWRDSVEECDGSVREK